MQKLLVKPRKKLSKDEKSQIGEAQAREFKVTSCQKINPRGSLFFLLKEDKTLLAMGVLIPVEPIHFDGKRFFILGIGGVVANEKGKGYGRRIMMAIKKYLVAKNKTGIGFCTLKNKGFYEKCGFGVDVDSIKRFVFLKGNKKITNSGDDCVIYLDGSDGFMEKVLASSQEIMLPRPPDW